jgi:hypothetical protein
MKAVLVVIYWTWQGKRFGNKVADFIGIHRSLYHGAMEEGGCHMHMMKLYHFKKMELPLALVAHDSCKYLALGLICLKDRFGPQELIEQAQVMVDECASRECEDAGSCFL